MAALLLASELPSDPSKETPTAGPSTAKVIYIRADLSAGLAFGGEVWLGPTEGPVLLNAATTIGIANAWRVGVSTLPFALAGAQVAPFFGFVSPVVIPSIGPGLPYDRIPLEGGFDGATFGMRARWGDETRWLTLAPAWWFPSTSRPHEPSALVTSAAYSVLGATPPIVEYGWQVRPGLDVAFRTAYPFLSVKFAL